MAKEEQLFSVKCNLKNRDYSEVYRIYLEVERRKERVVAVCVCGALVVLCLVLMIALHNLSFLFYALICVLIGVIYLFVPANRKFIVTNRLQYGENMLIRFFPHEISYMELLPDEEMTEEEIDSYSDSLSTVGFSAYETEQGFLFAYGKITTMFLYVPKRDVSEEELPLLQNFAKEHCSGGYRFLEMKPIFEDEENGDEDPYHLEEAFEKYYGTGKLHVYDEDGKRADVEDAFDEDFDEDMTEEEFGEEMPEEEENKDEFF